jgi:hypothetical protein
MGNLLKIENKNAGNLAGIKILINIKLNYLLIRPAK